MLFRLSKEEVAFKGKRPKVRERNLVSVGTFGPIMGMVIDGVTAAHCDLSWSWWERDGNSPAAVFGYVVSRPLFEVGFCCIADGMGTTPFDKRTGFHGEIAIDPASSAVLRLTVEADLEPRLPLERSAIMVEYGTQVLGGKT